MYKKNGSWGTHVFKQPCFCNIDSSELRKEGCISHISITRATGQDHFCHKNRHLCHLLHRHPVLSCNHRFSNWTPLLPLPSAMRYTTPHRCLLSTFRFKLLLKAAIIFSKCCRNGAVSYSYPTYSQSVHQILFAPTINQTFSQRTCTKSIANMHSTTFWSWWR